MSIQLTLEQEALISSFRESWKQIALSTERIDFEKTRQSVVAAYAFLDKASPDVLFFESPYAALNSEILLDLHQSGASLFKDFFENFCWSITNPITNPQQLVLSTEQEERFISEDPWINRGKAVYKGKDPWVNTRDDYAKQLKELYKEKFGLSLVHNLLSGNLRRELGSLIFEIERLLEESIGTEKFVTFEGEPRGGGQSRLQYFCIQTELWSWVCCDYDYEISVLGFNFDQTRWNILKNIMKTCGWLIPYEDTCIVCDRPLHVSLEAESSIGYLGDSRAIQLEFEFLDGFGKKPKL